VADPSPPEVRAFHHVTLTVTDLERSVEWYERVLGLPKVADRAGDGWVRALLRAPSGVMIGLTRHEGTGSGDGFDHLRVGLDHVSIACADRAEVERWAAHLDRCAVPHGEIVDAPAGHVLVCRDPDGIPVELFAPRA
jgi:catechol 2,3-dioxygenase-like lactoylglutathione lyase family enzyme